MMTDILESLAYGQPEPGNGIKNHLTRPKYTEHFCFRVYTYLIYQSKPFQTDNEVVILHFQLVVIFLPDKV